MKTFFAPNIDGKGRAARAITALLLFAGAIYGYSFSPWIGIALGAFGALATFEALRGWCIMRACGVKTRY